jgi:hypothetical protein
MWAKYLAGNFGTRFQETGPDGVQIWSRFGPDFTVQTVWTNFGNHPLYRVISTRSGST